MRMLLAVLCVLVSAEVASACNRCGVFGRGCRFHAAAVHAAAAHAPVVAAAQPTVVITNVYPQPLVAPVAQQGTTLYGLSSTLSSVSLDTQATLNLSARLADSSLDLARQANANVAALAAHDIEVKKILAAGIANAQTVAAANSGAVSVKATVQGSSVKVEHSNVPVSTDPIATIQALSNQYCVKCHGGATPKANLDLTNVRVFSASELEDIAKTLVSSDPGTLMPRGKDGKGVMLPYNELSAWLCAVGALNAGLGEVDPVPVTP